MYEARVLKQLWWLHCSLLSSLHDSSRSG